MSNPNPLVPQGSLLEQQARSKSTFQMAAFIVALHVVVLGGFLFLGCKKEDNQAHTPGADTFAAPPPILSEPATNAPAYDPFAAPTNTTAFVPPVTNLYTPPVTPPAVEPGNPAPTAPAAAPGATAEHVVKKNEIAYALAKKNGVSLKQLQEANPGKDLAKLKVGDKLQIPAAASAPVAAAPAASTHEASTHEASTHEAGGKTYTVKGGDNLSRLAKKFGTTVKAIREANGMTSNEIKVGQKLKIPGKPGTASAAEPAVTPASAAPLSPPVVTPANPLGTPGQPGTPQ